MGKYEEKKGYKVKDTKTYALGDISRFSSLDGNKVYGGSKDNYGVTDLTILYGDKALGENPEKIIHRGELHILKGGEGKTGETGAAGNPQRNIASKVKRDVA